MRTQNGHKQQKTKKTTDRGNLPQEKSWSDRNDNLIFGRNSVIEALEAGRKIEKVLVLDGGTGSLRKIVGMAKDSKVRLEFVDRKTIKALLPVDKFLSMTILMVSLRMRIKRAKIRLF